MGRWPQEAAEGRACVQSTHTPSTHSLTLPAGAEPPRDPPLPTPRPPRYVESGFRMELKAKTVANALRCPPLNLDPTSLSNIQWKKARS